MYMNSREKTNYKTQFAKHINKTEAGTSNRNYKSKPLDERIGARNFNGSKKTFQQHKWIYKSSIRNDDLLHYKSRKYKNSIISEPSKTLINRTNRMYLPHQDPNYEQNIILDNTGKYIIKTTTTTNNNIITAHYDLIRISDNR